jgi:hypothetical protein
MFPENLFLFSPTTDVMIAAQTQLKLWTLRPIHLIRPIPHSRRTRLWLFVVVVTAG